jgi:hypothetical protein
MTIPEPILAWSALQGSHGATFPGPVPGRFAQPQDPLIFLESPSSGPLRVWISCTQFEANADQVRKVSKTMAAHLGDTPTRRFCDHQQLKETARASHIRACA